MFSELSKIDMPKNEVHLTYAPNTPERKFLEEELARQLSIQTEAPMRIGNALVRTDSKVLMTSPHEYRHVLGTYYKADKEHVARAAEESQKAKKGWAGLSFESKASIFLKGADLLAGPYRQPMNAAIMLGQSKNVFQAEIDTNELIDFWRFNVYFARKIYEEQPESAPGVWNRTDWRPLEGFVFALTPFNFTCIAGNLPTAPALMGNTVVWKPANTQIYSAQVIMEVLDKAGLPPGVINLIYPSGKDAGEVIFKHPDFEALNFTGSTEVAKGICEIIGQNSRIYKALFPRIIAETGGKNAIIAHASADPKEVSTGTTRAGFECQGQKCSAASRIYIPRNLRKQVMEDLLSDWSQIREWGPPTDFTKFINAVIDEAAFDKITGYIELAKASDDAQIIAGGNYDKSVGYFIEPTLIEVKRPDFITMREEIFGPVVSIFVYDPNMWSFTLDLVNQTSPYGLTCSVFARDRKAIEEAQEKLRYAAGNFYINNKPTGAIVGQQPFGGARASGTNDKAGSKDYLKRFLSPRTISETSVPPTDFKYPFMRAL